MPDTEIVTVTGTVDSIVVKGPSKWQAIVKTPESPQYGKKCWYDDPDVNAVVTSLLTQVATFECRTSHYTLPDGKPSTSLWINSVNPGSPPPQEPPGASEAVQAVAQEAVGATESASEPVETVKSPYAYSTSAERAAIGDPRQASIERQVALKCAVEIAPLLPNVKTIANVLEVAEEFDRFLARALPF